MNPEFYEHLLHQYGLEVAARYERLVTSIGYRYRCPKCDQGMRNGGTRRYSGGRMARIYRCKIPPCTGTITVMEGEFYLSSKTYSRREIRGFD